ncbi:MAG TPA: Zn-ribbon domain-containing OB-fold protein [Anaerolineae bacterium]
MAILDNLEHAVDAQAMRGSLPTRYRYTAGVAGQKFLAALRDEGTLLGSRCDKCQYTYVPPRMYCERCFAALPESAWIRVGPSGTLLSFTLVHLDLEDKPLDPPRLLGLIQLDGASGTLVHDLSEVERRAVRIGLRVTAVFKTKPERSGSILDIRYFKPE